MKIIKNNINPLGIALLFFILGLAIIIGISAYRYGVYSTSISTKNNNNSLDFSLKETCPYVLGNNNSRYITSTSFVGEEVTFPPVIISPTPKTLVVKIPFDPKKPDIVWQNWKNEISDNPTKYSNASPWAEGDFDVDKDGKSEKILVADTQIDHGGNWLEIVKDNNIIFETRGVNLKASSTPDNNGFYLTETKDLWDGNFSTITRKTRYIFDSGRFIPIWYQDSCSIVQQ